jgi:hypothetical protein
MGDCDGSKCQSRSGGDEVGVSPAIDEIGGVDAAETRGKIVAGSAVESREHAIAVRRVGDGTVWRSFEAGHGDGAGSDIVEDAACGRRTGGGVTGNAGPGLLTGEIVEHIAGVAQSAAALLVD